MLIAAGVLLPIVAILVLAFFPSDDIWSHLLATTLPRYLSTTLALMLCVGFGAACIGAGTAWLVTRYWFWGVRSFEWLLLMPLAIPAYVGAYALVDLLEYAGPVQSALRGVMGWTTAQDYWFFEIRSFGAASFVLTMALYPYVYLLSRAAFREQSGAVEEVAQSLGSHAFLRFWKIGLPLARPAIAAGTAIVMMETINDFGAVDYFAIQTLTTGIFSVWLEGSNAGGAAQLATLGLCLIIILVLLEKNGRHKMRFFSLSTHHRPILRQKLRGRHAVFASVFCVLPVLFGFILPTLVLALHAVRKLDYWKDADLYAALWNTVFVGAIAAFFTVAAGLVMVYGVRLSQQKLPRRLLPLTTIGYAAPGAVLAVGILIPLAAFDNALADFILAFTGREIGLILTGTSFAVILAYFVRFFAIAQGAADTAMERVSPNLSQAARSLGRSKREILVQIFLPLIKGSLGSALVLVFVDCVKELPATMLLRPFNFSTLATRTHDQASLENLPQAAPAALLIILVGLFAVGLLARASR
ncbi:ABC transporter permease subunit [Rhodobacteraceae bacterium IMCC15231]|nr:ABC transporter permease subunit [Rhodobacteraceae bacterium IMCC15231]